MVSTVKTDAEDRHICPNCGQHYEPDAPSKEDATPNTYEKEQYITGLCSDECWNDYLGIRG